jgi:zinc D-Ala-D-Ala dipeptidase
MTMKNIFILSVLLLITSNSCKQQNNGDNPYGLKVISKFEDYQNTVEKNTENKMVDITGIIPGIMLDIRYAGANNFTGTQVYSSPEAFLRFPVAKALEKVQSDLKTQGLGLKVFDAYRPYAATVKFYEIIGDTNFVAAPWHGSRHNRGCAVDVTLIDLKDGAELAMPTAFDDFTLKAAPDYPNLPDTIIANRNLLINAMQKHGFTVYPHEWWHFDYKGWENFDLMDISFQELNSIDQ